MKGGVSVWVIMRRCAPNGKDISEAVWFDLGKIARGERVV